MRVVHLDPYYIPELGYDTAWLAHKQVMLGYDVHVVCGDKLPFEKRVLSVGENPCLSDDIQLAKGVNVYHLRSISYRDRVLWLVGLFRVLKQLKPDIVHCHDILNPFALVPSIYRRINSFRLIYCVHVADFNTDTSSSSIRRLIYAVYRHTQAQLLRASADAIVAIGENEQALSMRLLGLKLEQVPVIPLGADTALFKPNPDLRLKMRATLDLSDNDVVLIHVGTLAPRKRIDLLLSALSHCLTAAPNLRAIVIGGGDADYAEQLKNQVKGLRLDKHVKLIDRYISRSMIAAYYAASDIGVWPGHISNAAVEAVSCGLPLIAVDDPYNRRLISKSNGLLVPAQDERALQQAILELATNTQMRRQMGQRSRDLALETLDWAVIARRFHLIYEQGLGGI
jgi:glycosyltransferase involved in cell wall biosynthesis